MMRWFQISLLVVTLAFANTGPIAATPDGGPHWDAEEAAAAFAQDLLQAQSIPQVHNLLLELLELLDIGVFASDGSVVVPSTSVLHEDDFYLYDFQVRLIAEQFLEQRYQPLEEVAGLWREVGIVVQVPGDPFHVGIDGLIVEQEMRSLRRWAEEHPEEPSGFLIRLIDALGQRETAPFDLLADVDEEETQPAAAPTYEEQIEDQLRTMFDTMLEDEDMDEGFDEETMFEAILSGDMAKMVKAAVGEEGLDKIQESLAEAKQAPTDDPESPMEAELFRQVEESLDRTSSMFAGTGDHEELFEQSLALLENQRDTHAQLYQSLAENLHAEAAEREQKLQEPDADAADVADAAWSNLSDMLPVLDNHWLWQSSEEAVEQLRQTREIMAAEEEFAERTRAAFPTGEADPPRSTLVLDPIQSLLLQIDLLVPPHDPEDLAGAVRSVRTDSPQWQAEHGPGQAAPQFPLLLVQQDDQRSLGSELLGILNDRLQAAVHSQASRIITETAGEGFKRLKKRLDIPGQVLDIIHGSMVMMAHTTTVDVQYHPNDAQLGDGIRLRSSSETSAEDIRQRRIEVTVTVTFDPPQAAQAVEWGRMRMAQFVRYTIPGTAPWLFGHYALDKMSQLEFPEPGPRENVPVQLRYGKDLRMKTLVIDTEEWMQPGLMLALTDEDGQAVVNFGLRMEEEPAATWGGRPHWVFGETGARLRVHPITQMHDGGIWSYQEVAFGVADWLQGVTGLGATDTAIHIEGLEPVPWEGSVEFRRSVVINVDVGADGVEDRDVPGYRTTYYYTNEDWLLQATSPQLEIEGDEASSDAQGDHASWQVALSGSHQFSQYKEGWEGCLLEGHDQCIAEQRIDIERHGTASIDGGNLAASPVVRLETDGEQYKVNVTMIPRIGTLHLDSNNVSFVRRDCEGAHSNPDREQRLAEEGGVLVPAVTTLLQSGRGDFMPVADQRWPEFDRNTETLSDSVRWPSRIDAFNVRPSYRARPTIMVHNELQWTFTRDLEPRVEADE